MGFIRNDAIVVSSWKKEHADIARAKAVEIGLTCTEVVTHPSNGGASFLIVPDGSKEGWEDSDNGDRMRLEWKTWAYGADADPSHLFLGWVHVSYPGDPDCNVYIVQSSKRDEDE